MVEHDAPRNLHPRVFIRGLPAHKRKPSIGSQTAADVGERADRIDKKHDAKAGKDPIERLLFESIGCNVLVLKSHIVDIKRAKPCAGRHQALGSRYRCQGHALHCPLDALSRSTSFRCRTPHPTPSAPTGYHMNSSPPIPALPASGPGRRRAWPTYPLLDRSSIRSVAR